MSIWDRIFENNLWRGETPSGKGSSLKYTNPMVPRLQALIDKYNINTLFDAPCGDYNWVWQLDVNYSGGDISESVIRSTSQEQPNVRVFDVTKDPIPEVDAWLCRDCLNHLKNDNVNRALANFLNSKAKWLILSNHPKCKENKELASHEGHYRELNFELDPYNLPVEERIIDYVPPFPERELILIRNPNASI